MTRSGAASRPLRAAIVGAGLMGRWHAHAVARAPGGHVVACIVDAELARARSLAARHRGATAAPSLADAFASGPIDVVHVCAPLAAHDALTREAIAGGAHVIVEKPVAADGDGTAALLDLAESHGRLLVPVHQFLFQRGVQQVLAALPSLGTLRHVDAVACTAGAAGRSPAAHDRLAIEVMPHALALLARIVAPTVDMVTWQTRHVAPGEVRADGVLRGTTVSILVSTNGRPTVNALRLVGSAGTAHVDLFHGFATIAHGRATRGGKIVQPFAAGGALLGAATANLARRFISREPAYPGLRELIALTYRAAADGTPAPISPAETLAVARALDAIAGQLSQSELTALAVRARQGSTTDGSVEFVKIGEHS